VTQTSRIAVLSPQVADQIAAGEVVERPASVVKELVENALDAGAQHVEVALEDGGRTLVRVTDDGEGMTREDARLALERHATSKIRRVEDLIGVATFGFRGEALPAIASVSRLELETAATEGQGVRLRVVGGRVEKAEEAARRRGTTVTVRGLFFNTPARRKFLRAARTETRAAAEVVTLFAMGCPDIRFTLTSDDRRLIETRAGETPEDRIASLWGPKLAGTLVPVEHRVGPLEVRGFVQRPADAQPAGRKAHLFINGRPFRDPFVLRAAEAGYRSAIHPGDRPTVILFLDLPGDGVDVNVHPAKLEVRFRDKFFVEKAVEQAVREALGELVAAATVVSGSGEWGGVPPDALAAALRRSEPLPSPHSPDAPDLFPASPEAVAAAAPHVPDLLQVFDTYILFESGPSVVIVDQHSAHERVLYETIMRQLEGDGASAQRLLLPFTMDCAPDELDAIEAHRELLTRVGYEVAPFGGRSVVVHSVPNPHPRFDAQRCLQELAADLAKGRFGGFANRLERFAATYACRAAIKGGQQLDPEEMRELLLRLLTAELPAHDVHGRPTIVQLPKDELERRFGRR